MAHFRATIGGGRGEASRLGTKNSGMVADVNGWTSGVRVVAEYDAKGDFDKFQIFRTTGSSHRSGMEFIGTVTEAGFVPAPDKE